ncbi:DUF2188 domain-containing protein [Mesorhizobium sp. CC13]|uniref:DUF2188 domain-containing protein n=1 Tax=Mesorhizobium sp. CC13 TaxID=3029194 RepID=UPI003264A543
MVKHNIFHTVPGKKGWNVKEGGEIVSSHKTQKLGWAAAVKACRAACETGRSSKAVLHRVDGSIREERLYDRSPSQLG